MSDRSLVIVDLDDGLPDERALLARLRAALALIACGLVLGRLHLLTRDGGRRSGWDEAPVAALFLAGAALGLLALARGLLSSRRTTRGAGESNRGVRRSAAWLVVLLGCALAVITMLVLRARGVHRSDHLDVGTESVQAPRHV